MWIGKASSSPISPTLPIQVDPPPAEPSLSTRPSLGSCSLRTPPSSISPKLLGLLGVSNPRNPNFYPRICPKPSISMPLIPATAWSMEFNQDLGFERYCRLSNTTHSEIAPSLSLPSLPVCFGSFDQQLGLSDVPGGSRSGDRPDILAHAGTIAELLRNCDVDYL